ncbi:MAG: hypothetical protein S4CHLAM102_04520 [Chlamydiia bacterium]|nr:hypothetical protein [Chlamydiia bacterium]
MGGVGGVVFLVGHRLFPHDRFSPPRRISLYSSSGEKISHGEKLRRLPGAAFWRICTRTRPGPTASKIQAPGTTGVASIAGHFVGMPQPSQLAEASQVRVLASGWGSLGFIGRARSHRLGKKTASLLHYLVYYGLEVGGRWGYKGEGGVGMGMGEVEGVGVEELAVGCGGGVEGVAEDGGVEVVEVDADLVGAAGDGLGADEEEVGGGGEDFKVGLGGLTGFGLDGHFFAVCGVAADGGVDVEGLGAVTGDGEVFFFHLPVGKLVDEVFVRLFGFGADNDAGGIFIEAVDDAGAGLVGGVG